mgnify:CR=1 FL=1
MRAVCRSIACCLLLAASPFPALAEEGMWMPGQTQEIAAARVGAPTTTIPIDGSVSTGHVMVWLKSLPAAGDGGYQVSISQISIR